MAYVATVNLIKGGTFTGTSFAISGENAVLTGSLTTTSASGDATQYNLTPLGTGTAVIPKGDILSVSVA